MKPHEIEDTEAIGWHVIARGGDMTARVHPGMCLGEGRPGELSFESADAIVTFHLDEDGLSLEVISDDHELLLPPRRRLRAFHVKPKTQVEFAFLGHGLYIDNDLAIANPPEDTIRIAVVGLGETLDEWPVAMGPLSAGHRLVAPMQAGLPVDYLQREHALARADKQRLPVGAESNLSKRLRTPLTGTVFVVLAIALVAILTETQVLVDDRSSSDETEAVVDMPVDTGLGPVPSGGRREMVDPDVLARFSALLDAEPLPDKAIIDFAVESLKSLRTAYPNDPRVPESLERLTERLVSEAKRSYDGGDRFLAGRLMEQASTIGEGQETVEATLAYFAGGSPALAVPDAPGTEPAPVRNPGQQSSEQPIREPVEELVRAGAEADLVDPAVETSQGAVAESTQGSEPEPVAEQGLSADLSAPDVAGSASEESDAIETAAIGPPEKIAAAEALAEDSAPLMTSEPGVAVQDEPLERAVLPIEEEPREPAVVPLDAEEPATLEALLAVEETEGPDSAELTGGVTDGGATPGALSTASEPTMDADAAAVDRPPEAGSSSPTSDPRDDPETRAVLGEFVVGAVTAAPDVEDSLPRAGMEDPVSFPDTPIYDEPPSSPEAADGQLEPVLASLPDETDRAALDPLSEGSGADDLEAFQPAPDVPEPAEAGIEASESGEGTRFYAFSKLNPTFMVPLEYPGRVPPGAEGTVVLEFTVSESGEVEELEVRGDAAGFFIRAAERTVRRWRFEPVLEEGNAVPVRTALRVRFRG